MKKMISMISAVLVTFALSSPITSIAKSAEFFTIGTGGELNGNTQAIVLDHYRIYSLKYANGNSEVIYKRDSIIGRNYTVKQMGAFVAGERYGFEHFNGTGTIIYGLLAGGGAAFMLRGILAAPAAIALGFTTLIPPPQKINPEDVADKELLKEKYFLEGYKRVVRSKRLGRGIVSAIGGAALGITIAVLTE